MAKALAKAPGPYTQVDLSEPRSGLTEQPRPSGLGLEFGHFCRASHAP